MDIKTKKYEKSLLALFPNVADEWHPLKNMELSPANVGAISAKKVWWLGKCGHEWEAIVHNRTRRGDGCPYCNNKRILRGFNDLVHTNPNVAKYWHSSKNGELTAFDVHAGSAKKVWWYCIYYDEELDREFELEWQRSVREQVCAKTPCPYLAKPCQDVLPGFNDLETRYPHITKEWDYEKNDKKPSEILCGTEYKAFWKCLNGHSWKARVVDRVRGNNCPKCSQYLHTSFPEQALYYYCKQAFSDCVNSYKIEGYEIDIYIPNLKLGIEYDGIQWHTNIEKDKAKNELLKKNGIKLIRVREKGLEKIEDDNCKTILIKSNHDNDIEKMLLRILTEIGADNVTVDIKRDRTSIYELYILSNKEKSIGELFPALIERWDYEKNGNITPYMVHSQSGKIFWWKCKNGHSYQASPNATCLGKGLCDVCLNRKIVSGVNDISTIHPEIVSYWDIDKNKVPITEAGISYHKEYWWKCENGHSWYGASSAMRNNKIPCPYCGNRVVLKGFNDFETCEPELMLEWDFDKNTDIDPSTILAGKQVRVWWKCKKCGFEWQALTQNRRAGERKNTGCPQCAEVQRRITNKRKIKESGRSFAKTYPELLLEWDYSKNREYDPEYLGPKSGEIVWWKCAEGHEWKTAIYTRAIGSGCPICAKGKSGQASKKKVLNIDTGEVFDSVTEAANKYKCSLGSISNVCKGKSKKSCGYHWKFI